MAQRELEPDVDRALKAVHPRVQMFIWFIYRDSPTQGNQWEGAGGVVRGNNASKPSLRRFTKAAKQVDARNGQFRVKAGKRTPKIEIPVRELKARNATGSQIGISYNMKEGKRLLGNAIASGVLTRQGTVAFRPKLTVKKGKRYVVNVTLSDINGNKVTRRIELRSG